MGERVQIGPCLLIHADCRSVMDAFADADLLMSDPPYGVDSNTEGRGRGGQSLKGIVTKGRGFRKIDGDKEPFDPSPWLSYPKVVLWGGNHFCSRLPDAAGWIVWDKRCGVAPDDNADCEMAWTNLPGVARIHRQLWKGLIRAGEENIARSGGKLHPHQKPVALHEFVIRRAKLQPGSLIADPFMGSASIGKAAIRLGMRYVGCETDREHFETAVRSIRAEWEAHVASPSLFAEPTAKAKAPDLFGDSHAAA
ncbi:site-specific DNA-methyltransferase (adenine-specific)/modification methylase [Azospirillum agricola]|uniref:DNA methyltransferase n=1 Tax=Azospirillum agricola TaxID=1720247 RepID=UPI001AEA5BBC|nr:DNA methyltransferase [Azospirillum agricola]MBP2232863.1 site-specific DNA-methyltransferase (adenine-specific)/modification methylase [Azospirillum agricola]